MLKEKSKYIFSFAIIILSVTVFILIYLPDKNISFENIKRIIMYQKLCFFRNITGLPCPGCGMTRAYISLISLDIKKSFYYHPLFILPIIITSIIVLKNKSAFFNKLYKNEYLWICMIMLVILVYIFRFVTMFPNIEPFTYTKENITFKTFLYIKKLIY